MRHKRRTPLRVATQGAHETNSFAGLAKGGFERNSKPTGQRHARGWRVETQYRARRAEYVMAANDGITFVTFFGKTIASNHLCAQLEAELRGAIEALNWPRHITTDTPCEIRFSSCAFGIFMGEEECPHELRQLLDKVRRAYLASSDAIRIDRQKQALVATKERLAA